MLLICREAQHGQTALTSSNAVCNEASVAAGHHQPGLISPGWTHSPWLPRKGGGNLKLRSPFLPKPSAGITALRSASGGVRHPCLGREVHGRPSVALGVCVIWVFKASCVPLTLLSYLLQQTFIDHCPAHTLFFSIFKLPVALGAYRGLAGNAWSSLGVMQYGVVETVATWRHWDH